jgi:hypothetical protein
VPTALVRRARTLCDTENLGGEIRHLKRIFQQNGLTRMISGKLCIQNRSQN